MILEKRIPLAYWWHKIKWDILIVTIFSSLLFFLAQKISRFDIPISIATFMGTAIALLLSFKLSQSYDRWWEARKIWGEIVNDSRSLVMQLKSFTQSNPSKRVKAIAYRQIALCFALSKSLRGQNPIENLNNFISEAELERLKATSNVPIALLNTHTGDIASLKQEDAINEFQQIQLDSTVVRLCASVGKAERIKNTVFPKTYRLTLHLFIYIFLVSLALALSDLHALVEIPLMVAISIPFFLLEKIALSIQDPFENKPSDTAMTTISRAIEINIKELLDSNEVPKPLPAELFYVL